MSLRDTFDRDAELYDRARPEYPAELFDDLAALAELRDRARIVEIGCGTGQATVALAERGYRLTCVELGARLAAFARRKLARFENVDVVNADVERWEPKDGYDAAVAFTSFHWLDPVTRYETAAQLLRDGGMLCVVGTNHVLGTDDFFVAVQEDYDAVVPAEPGDTPAPPEALRGIALEIDASGLFATVGERRYLWELAYTADEYIELLRTYSGHIALDDARRDELFRRIRRRIEQRPGALVRKAYLTTLDVGRRL